MDGWRGGLNLVPASDSEERALSLGMGGEGGPLGRNGKPMRSTPGDTL